jgi:hypothetical protein
MALNDLLSSSFLFSIAIIIILIGGIFAYVSYRMSEQDHKISSMLGLISTMAGELQFFRSQLSDNHAVEIEPTKEKIILDPNNLIIGQSLISVSDDEDDDEEEDIDDDVEDDDDDDDDEEEEEEEDIEDDIEEDEIEEDDIEEDDVEEDDIKEINIDEENNLEEMIDLEDTIENIDNIKSIHLEEPIDLNFTNKEDEPRQMDELLTSDLKSISITDLEEPNKKQDYKKMSINKLREVVVEKGIIAEASKLKKQDILKLLGDE